MDAPIFRSWTCPDLKVKHPTKPFNGPGTIELRANGELDISIVASGEIEHLEPCDVRISGKTDAGNDVVVEHACVHQVSGHILTSEGPSKVHLRAYRCEIRTPSYDAAAVTREVFHLKNAKFWGKGSFTRGASRVTLSQYRQHDIPPGHVSAEIKFEHTGDEERVSYDALEPLLRLAQRSLVLAPCHEEFCGDTLTRTVLYPDTREAPSRRPLIPWFGEYTAQFLGKTIAAYLAKAPLYDLDAMIQYYIFAYDSSHTMEVQFMFASVFMEGLKFNWAKNVSGLHPEYKANGIVAGFKTNPSHKSTLSFEDVMKRMAAHLGYRATFTFIEDRNAIFHSGRSAGAMVGQTAPYTLLNAELLTLYDQMDDIILRILGYNGVMRSPRDPNEDLSFPSRAPARQRWGAE